jgi:hypothetical protein
VPDCSAERYTYSPMRRSFLIHHLDLQVPLPSTFLPALAVCLLSAPQQYTMLESSGVEEAFEGFWVLYKVSQEVPFFLCRYRGNDWAVLRWLGPP